MTVKKSEKGQRISFRDYPLFSASSDGERIVVSGGGGGLQFGIDNYVEVLDVDRLTGKVEVIVSDALGIFDDIRYSKKLGVFCAGLDENCVIFKIDKDKLTKDEVIHILAKWQTFTTDPTKPSCKNIQSHCAISSDGSLIAVSDDNSNLKIYRLIVNINQYGHETYIPILTASTSFQSFKGFNDIQFTKNDKHLLVTGKNGICGVVSATDLTMITEKRFSFMNCRKVRCLNSFSNTMELIALGQTRDNKMSYISKCRVTFPDPSPTLDNNNDDLSNNPKTVYWQDIKTILFKNVKFLNCMDISEDGKLLACSSNTTTWIYSLGDFSLRCKKIRGMNGEYYDLPTTGLQFIQKDSKIMLTAADYTLSIIDVPAYPTSCLASRLWTLLLKTLGFFGKIFILYILISIALIVIVSDSEIIEFVK